MTALVVAVLVVAVTSAVQGALGFGMNLLAVPVLVVLDPLLVPGPAVAAGLGSNLSTFFVVTAAVALVALALAGHFGGRELHVSALLLPGVLVGFAASGPLRPLVDRGRTRPAVLCLSAAAGVGAVVEGLV